MDKEQPVWIVLLLYPRETLVIVTPLSVLPILLEEIALIEVTSRRGRGYS